MISNRFREDKKELAERLLFLIIILVVIMAGMMYRFFTHNLLTIAEYSIVFGLVTSYFVLGIGNCYKIRTFRHHMAIRMVFFVISCIFLTYTFAINIMEGFHFDGQLIPLQGELFLMLVPIQCLANGIKSKKENK